MKKIKKWIKKTSILVLILLASVSSMQLPIKAATNVTLGKQINYSYSVTNTNGITSFGANTNIIYANGELAFCVEPGVVVNPGSLYSSSNFETSQSYSLAIIAYEGWEKSSKTSEDYLATQFMIWEKLGATINSTSFSGYKTYKARIQDRVNHNGDAPSFDGYSITLNVGETKTLTDTKGIFKDYTFVSNDGLIVKKNGNDLIITATASAKNSSRVTYNKIPNACVGIPLLFSSGASQDVSVLKLNDPHRTYVNVKVNKLGALKITKQDEDGIFVPNTSFRVSTSSNMSNPIGTYTTGADGTVTIPNIGPGTVYIQETAVPVHLVLDSTIKTATINPNSTTTFTASNQWVKGKLLLKKNDAESSKQVAGAVYGIFDQVGTEVQRLTTPSSDYAESDYLRYGNYTVKEVTAPDGYVLNPTVYPVTINNNEQKIEVTGVDKRVKGSINLSKEDSVTGKPQGEATLEGAVYELKARNNILDPADKSVKFTKDQVVSNLTTDADANATVTDLYLGDYYLKEKTPSTGYTLDPTEYEISLTYENQSVEIVTKQQTVLERVIAQAFSIIKISDNGNGAADNLQGAEFTIKAQTAINNAGSWEKAPVAKNAQGKDASILVTDNKGYALSDELPYGTYVVRETKVPDDHYAVPDFTIVISEDNRDPQPWIVLNDVKFRAVVAVVKKDADTGKTVAVSGTSFKIKNLDTGNYVGSWVWNPLPHYVDTFITDESGQVMTPNVLNPGNYQLEEIKAPEGYTIDPTPIKFKVSMNTAYELLPDGTTPVITLLKDNKSVKGRINVKKQGEVLSGMDTKLTKQFNYKIANLENTVFEITANEDIYSADNQKDLIYKKGTVVDTITTAKDGTAQSKELPLAKYQVKEKQAPTGFVGSDIVKDVELTYADQNTSIVYGDAGTYTNDRQKVSLEVIKKDADIKTPLSGAQFVLQANEDIKAVDGTILLKKGEFIEMATSDNNGIVKFKSDLPLAKYRAKEIKAPIGYASSNAIIDFDASYQGQDIKVVELKSDFENEIITYEFSKVDISNDQELPGAHMVVLDENNQPFDTWISTITPHFIKGLEVGKTYTLRETSSPYGYAKAQDITFTVKDTGEIQKVKMADPLVVGKLSFVKTGEAFNATVTGQNEFGKTESPVWNKQNLLGAEVSIYANEDITIGNTTYYKKGRKIETLESDYEAVQSKELLVGKYYYIETKTPHGYITDTDKHFFEIKDSQSTEVQIIESTLDNKRPFVDIDMTKTLEKQTIFEDKEAYKDVIFGIYARENIYDYKGNVAIENGAMIGTSGISEDGHLVNTYDLPNGVYFIRELQTNSQYKLDPTEYDFEIGYKGGDVSNYVVHIGQDGVIDNKLARGSALIHKKDSFNSNKLLPGVGFNISANETMQDIIATVETDDKGIARFDDLELGTYYIQEAQQVDGYVMNDHIYKVEVIADGDIIDIEVKNKPTETEISKIGEIGPNELPGATLRAVEKESGKVIETWITTNDFKKLNYLTEGKDYIIEELIAPVGYNIADPITFTAKDGQKITMKDKLIRVSVAVNKVDSITKQAIKSKKFGFSIYKDKGTKELIKTIQGDEKTGIAIFEGLTMGTYYIKETEAPLGYILSKEVVKVEVIHEDVFVNGKKVVKGENDVYSIVYQNSPLMDDSVKTSDETKPALFVSLLLGSFVYLLILSKKKNSRDEKI